MVGPNDQASVKWLLQVLRERHVRLAVAEGDTGGLLLEWLTSVPGSSSVILGGVVAYHDSLKQRLLHVPTQLLQEHGAVSDQVAQAMAAGARQVAGAELGLACTGIAGPGGATPTKPVGLTWVAVSDAQRHASRQHTWSGDRSTNRTLSARAALDLVLEFVQ